MKDRTRAQLDPDAVEKEKEGHDQRELTQLIDNMALSNTVTVTPIGDDASTSKGQPK